jgi:hypothetical protein
MALIASAEKHPPQGICRQASCGLWIADCEARYRGVVNAAVAAAPNQGRFVSIRGLYHFGTGPFYNDK